MAKITFVSTPLKLFGDIFNDSWTMDLSQYNYCFQGCFYCFANLNKLGLGTAVGSLEDNTDAYIKRLQKAHGQGYSSESLVETFIRKRYTTIYSNNVDPFYPAAENKYKCAERLLTEWAIVKQPIFIQTKEVFTPNVFDLLVACKDHIIVYVTITSIVESITKETEKYSPPPAERLRRIRALTDAGVDCVVGMNPYLNEWVPDIHGFFQACADAGAKGVAAQALHFSRLQTQSIPEKFKPYVKKANQWQDFNTDRDLCEQAAIKAGIKFHYGRRPGDDFLKANTGKLPQFEGDAHWLHENLLDAHLENGELPVQFHWSEVEKYYTQFPILHHVFRTEEILQVIARSNDKYHHAKHALGKRTNLLKVMRYLWNDHEYMRFIGNYEDCKILADEIDDEDMTVDVATDENGDIVRVFAPKHDDLYFFENDEANAPNGILEWKAPEAGYGILPWAYVKDEGV
jgi:DNA repair photolyase